MIIVGKLGIGLHLDGPAIKVKARLVWFAHSVLWSQLRTLKQLSDPTDCKPFHSCSLRGSNYWHSHRCYCKIKKCNGHNDQQRESKIFNDSTCFCFVRLNFTSSGWCVAPPAVHKMPLPFLPKHTVQYSIWLVCKCEKLKKKKPHLWQRAMRQENKMAIQY